MEERGHRLDIWQQGIIMNIFMFDNDIASIVFKSLIC